MITVNKLLPRGQGLSAVLLKRAATVVLDWDTRQKSRFDACDSQGRALGVFLPRGSVVRGGDVLVAEDGSLIQVLAQPQAVMRVTPCAAHGTSVARSRRRCDGAAACRAASPPIGYARSRARSRSQPGCSRSASGS